MANFIQALVSACNVVNVFAMQEDEFKVATTDMGFIALFIQCSQ